MYTVTTKFQVVRRGAQVSGPCVVCKKKCVRKTMIENTVNPWNTDPETGQPRTREQVKEDVKLQAEQWEQNQPVVHQKCESLLPPPGS